ncbi:MAG: hypothetical protein KJ601_05695, partial [Nanoarchaeota archaeon]|nr:hypothetical protein [Nanoarchaeota archaeon]
NMKKILIGRSGFLKRLFKTKARNVIFLADEANHMNLKDAKQIKEYHENGCIKSVVFVGKELNDNMPGEIKELSGANVFKFGGLDEKDAIKLVRSRIGKLKMLPDDIIKAINKKSNNPRDLLKNLEDVFRLVLDSGESKINPEHVKKLLSS